MTAGVRSVVLFLALGFSLATAPAANLAAYADPPLPELTQPVHDFADVIDPSTEQQLWPTDLFDDRVSSQVTERKVGAVDQ